MRDLHVRNRPLMVEAAISFGLEAARDENGGGGHQAALELGQACLDLASGEMGSSHPMYVQALATIAESLRRMGRLQEARERAERACSVVRQLSDRSMLPDLLHGLARICADIGELTRARVLAWRAFHHLRFRGAGETATSEVLATLSLIECRRGRFTDASSLACAGLDALACASCGEHPVRARLLHNHGMALCMAGDLDPACSLLAQSLSERRRLLGHAHPETIEGIASLAALHLVRGDIGAALELYREAMGLAERALGKDHILVADCAVGLAFACRKLGSWDAKADALDLLERSRRIRQHINGGAEAEQDDHAAHPARARGSESQSTRERPRSC